MDGFLRALGFESKPEFTDKIPDNLDKDCFNVHNTFKHGFSSQPTCLGYDSVQQLLAIGTEHGAVLLLGKPGLERHIVHPTNVAVSRMEFITNKGLLVTSCDNNTLYLWSLREKEPYILHTLEFVTEKPTALSYVFGSEWMYIGTDAGNVHIVHLHTFKLSGFSIYWNNAVELSCRNKPGEVISVQEHPLDQGKVLIAFSNGKCVLFDMKAYSEAGSSGAQRDVAHKRFNYDPGSDHILTSVSWLGNGKVFGCSYSDGSIVMWNPKSETKPDKVFPLHDVDPTAFKPIYKLQLVYTESDPWILCTGGYPEGNDLAPRTLTVLRGKNPPRMLSSETTILDFLCLPSSPYGSDCQKPFALAILAKNELILHDLELTDLPRYPNYLLPYALDIHLPPVTFLHFCANCPDEFIASLHSVKSKLMKTSAKPWPLKGGKWGQEVPHTSTDLILTGHMDGSVRLWYCSSVILQPFFTLSTSRYFKMQYQPSETSSSTPSPTKKPSSMASSSPSPTKKPSSMASSSPSPTKKVSPVSSSPSPTKKVSPVVSSSPPSGSNNSPVKAPPPARPPPPKILTQKSCPEGVNKISSTMTPSDNVQMLGDNEKVEDEQGSKVAIPSPATGQQEQVSPSNSTDGVTPTMEVERSGTPNSGDRKVVYSHERKSIFRKKKKTNENSPHNSRNSTPTPDERELSSKDRASPTKGNRLQVSSDEKKKSPIFLKKSFRKVAKAVKIGRSMSRDKDKNKSQSAESTSVDEADGDNLPSEATGSQEDEQERKKVSSQHPKRPESIPLQQPHLVDEIVPTSSDSEQTANTPMIQQPIRSTSPGSDDFVHIQSQSSDSSLSSNSKTLPSRQAKTKTPKPSKSVKLPTLLKPAERELDTPLFTKASSPTQSSQSEDFFPIGNIQMGVCGLWLCVSNRGGAVLAFDFQLNERSTPPQAIDINFDSDSVIRQYAPTLSRVRESAAPTSPISSPVGQWVFTDKVQDSLPGFQLSQICTCYYHSEARMGRRGPKKRMSAKISVMKYSVDLGLLAVGTNRGFALVNTETNVCLYVLSSRTSILYMADPSKFTRQMRKESQSQLSTLKPLVKRHTTYHALTIAATTPTTPPSPFGKAKSSRASSQPHIATLSTQLKTDDQDELEDDCFDDQEMTVSELECSVTALELVQLQLDKQVPPTLTLWAGLACGHVVAYGVNILNHTKAKRKIELIPTKFITETKSPIVAVYFLNEWGDCQVIPYQPNRTNLAGSPESPSEKNKGNQTSPHTLEHYAIIVDENKLRSFSFPGCVKIGACSLPLAEGSAILQSEYFTCNDLPCLLSMTSNKNLFIHSLPGLKQLLSIPFNALCDTRAMCTFHVSGLGQGIFMSSESQLQRLSVVKEDKLNLPACLPTLYVRMNDPEPYHGGMGKRLMDALFTATHTVDREQIFGETARRPVGNLYKLDGRMGKSYLGQKDKDKEDQKLKARSKDGRDAPQAKGDSKPGVAGQLEKNVKALHERKEKLSAIEQRTEEVAQQASDFASLATRLRQKYES